MVPGNTRRNTQQRWGRRLSMMIKGGQEALGATNGGPKPGEYPLGSTMSRVAARAKLQQRLSGRKRRDLIVDSYEPNSEPILGKWSEAEDGSLCRVSILPEGMTIVEAERILVERGHCPSPKPVTSESHFLREETSG